MNEYKYSDLRAAALEDPTAENLAALGEWLQEYGGRDWNGESWDIENGHRLRPVYGDEPDEFDGFPPVGLRDHLTHAEQRPGKTPGRSTL